MFIAPDSGTRALRTATATANATAIAMTPGPQNMKLEKEARPIRGKQKRWKHPGHEEHEGVKQREHAEPRGRLADDIVRQTTQAVAG